MLLQAQVWDYGTTHGLVSPGARLLLAVSGGPDSLCLLDVMHALAGQHGLQLQVAHLDHQLRPESRDEAEFVRAQAAARGLAFHVEAADTLALASSRGLSIEEAARLARYSFLARVARQIGADAIVTAHTSDDQAETVLMHFLRGAGLAGLGGMRPRTDIAAWNLDWQPAPGAGAGPLWLVRPLLSTTRADVEAYCVEHGLAPRRDESNRDPRFLRNRLRHELLPELERYNPRIRSVLARMAEVLAGEHAMLARAIEALWQEMAPPEMQSEAAVVFDRDQWLRLSVPEQRALLRQAVWRLRRSLRDVDFTPLEAAVHFSRRARPGQGCDLVAGLRLSILPDRLQVEDATAPEPEAGEQWPQVQADGSLRGWQLTVEAGQADSLPVAKAAAAGQQQAPGWCVRIDADRLAGPLAVRARRPGERFQPLGLGGRSQKVSDFMINQKLAQPLRRRWPLVVSGEAVVWVAGLRLDERFRVTEATRRVLVLCLRPV
jgi:tRNA(Ile)-lysidine synthase